jgi:hypothetical protein
MPTRKTTKKQIHRKSPPKAHRKKTSKKRAPMSHLKRTTKKMVDDILLRVSPSVERQIDQLTQTLEKAPNSVGDFKVLGLKVLQRARVLSETLRKEAQKHKAQRNKKS